MKRRPRPSALSIAGLDPSGGAGLAADLRAFGAAGAWGCAVCAVVTVQSTAGLRSAHPLPPALVAAQAEEVLAHTDVRALKTGALGSAENVRAVAALVRARPRLPAVVDPVMIATRAPGGARLLDEGALEAMRELASLAALVTPNLDEAEALTGAPVRDRYEQREAAALLVGRGARAALVKGGHLEGDPEAADLLFVGGRAVVLRARRRAIAPFHGGGCTLAALVAGRLAAAGAAARDAEAIAGAARWAKRRLGAAIGRPERVGRGLLVLDVS
ncbi:MAG TPA: hydroxymethylpyrimidine/phosphomethylpyrimidine kinase [Polyangiaceae bacterium]|nr:hydroxymethylpyrimidine/phosphomethylpyrimidine kinase [Polyangiaceae bacterium]